MPSSRAQTRSTSCATSKHSQFNWCKPVVRSSLAFYISLDNLKHHGEISIVLLSKGFTGKAACHCGFVEPIHFSGRRAALLFITLLPVSHKADRWAWWDVFMPDKERRPKHAKGIRNVCRCDEGAWKRDVNREERKHHIWSSFNIRSHFPWSLCPIKEVWGQPQPPNLHGYRHPQDRLPRRRSMSCSRIINQSMFLLRGFLSFVYVNWSGLILLISRKISTGFMERTLRVFLILAQIAPAKHWFCGWMSSLA